MKWKLIRPSICLGEGCNMLATTMRRRGEEMGYNLIRMRFVSGYLAVNVRDYYWVEMLPGCITLPCLKEIQPDLSRRFGGRAPWYRRLSTIVRGTVELPWHLWQRRVEMSVNICPATCIINHTISGRCVRSFPFYFSFNPCHNKIPFGEEKNLQNNTATNVAWPINILGGNTNVFVVFSYWGYKIMIIAPIMLYLLRRHYYIPVV